MLDELGKLLSVQHPVVLDLLQELAKGLRQSFSLDGHWLVVIVHIVGQVYLAKGALSNFLDEPELLPDDWVPD